MEISARLRQLRDKSGWTTSEMSERSGIPKRTLEKYMLRDGASLPGFDALIAMSKGFGVSLDWLVFGAEKSNEVVGLLVQRCAFEAALMSFELLVEQAIQGHTLYKDGEILQRSPEEWAHTIAYYAAETAKGLGQDATTRAALLEWKAAKHDQVGEIFVGRLENFARSAKREDT